MGFEPPKPAQTARDASHDAFGDDIVEHPRAHPTGLTPVGSPVHDQHAELTDRFGGEEAEEEIEDSAERVEPKLEVVEPPVIVAAVAAPIRPIRSRCAPGTKAKAAFTLRLDPDRHLKLRLACAVDGRSAQQLVTDALDRMLERMPELDAMASKAKRKG